MNIRARKQRFLRLRCQANLPWGEHQVQLSLDDLNLAILRHMIQISYCRFGLDRHWGKPQPNPNTCGPCPEPSVSLVASCCRAARQSRNPKPRFAMASLGDEPLNLTRPLAATKPKSSGSLCLEGSRHGVHRDSVASVLKAFGHREHGEVASCIQTQDENLRGARRNWTLVTRSPRRLCPQRHGM